MRETFSKAEIDRIRDSTKISDVIGRFVTFDKRKSNPRRGDMWACCPFHGDKSASFHCEDQKGRYHCFGCGASGDAFKFLTEKTGCSFRSAVEQLGGKADIAEESPQERQRREADEAARRRKAEDEKNRAELNTRGHAQEIWNQGVRINGTLAESYLRNRGIDFVLDFPSLRFHPNLRYWDQATGRALGHFPALLAQVLGPHDEFLAVWRIYLDDKGNKNSKLPNAKLGLGAYAASGGAVRIGDPGSRANVCEGIETGLGIYGITGGQSVQCALSTSGMVNFIPPIECESVLIWPDGDVDRIRSVDGQERHVESPGMKAAHELEARLKARNMPVGVQFTPKRGTDYLDTYNSMRKRKAAKR